MNELLILLETARAGGWGALIALACIMTGLLLFDRKAKAPAVQAEEPWPLRKAA